MTTIEQRLAVRERPGGRPVMYHSWRQLTFLHWPVPAEQLQRLLPQGLTVDTHEGVAYAGLVPFTMHGIRLSWLPAVPGLSASHETNVRTYVVDENGVPGVWFFSLDAANAVFVQIARAWYRLPYCRAAMSVHTSRNAIAYFSKRLGGGREGCHVQTKTHVYNYEAEPGSLEFFLVERYVLYAFSRGVLRSGRVWHEPYPLVRATCELVEEDLVKVAQIERPDVAPHVLYSPGVDVEVFGLARSMEQE